MANLSDRHDALRLSVACLCRPCPSARKSQGEGCPNAESIDNGYLHVELSDIGHTIDVAINNIPKIYPLAFVDTYVIMPSHIHLILVIESGRSIRFHNQVAENGRQVAENGRHIAAPTV